MGWSRRGDVRDVGKGLYGCRRIAKERSESAYSLDTDGDGKTEEAGIVDKVEQINS